MKPTFALLTAALWLAGCGPAPAPASSPVAAGTAASAEQATAAMQVGNYAEAYCLWRSRASTGDAEAQFNLGWLYHNGYGLVVNDAEAARWWQMAAAQNHRDAHLALGSLYRLGGRDLPADTTKALQHLAAASVLGEEDASLALRSLLASGGAEVTAAVHTLIQQQPLALGPKRIVASKDTALLSKPGNGGDVLMPLAPGSAVVQLEQRGDWLEVGVIANGSRGWLPEASLVPLPAQLRLRE